MLNVGSDVHQGKKKKNYTMHWVFKGVVNTIMLNVGSDVHQG